MKKRIISVLCILMIIFSFSLNVFAESTSENTVSGIWQLKNELNIARGSPANSTGATAIGFTQDVNFVVYGDSYTYPCSNINILARVTSLSNGIYYKKYFLNLHIIESDSDFPVYSYDTQLGTRTYYKGFARCIIDFGSEPQNVSSDFYAWLNSNATRLTALEKVPDDSGSGESTPVIEYVYLKENRPMFETPLSDYSVTEGILLLIFVVTVLNNVFKSHIKG